MKVTLRKIQDMDRYGTVAQILDMVRTIIEKVNSENKNKAIFLPIVLNEASMQRLIEAEELAAAAAKEVANAQQEKEKHGGEEEMKEMNEEPMEETKEEEKNTDATIKPESDSPKYASVVKGVVDPPNGPVMNVRALYVVPPKKSRRRGIKSGCAYLVFTGPTVSEDEGSSLTAVQRSHATAKARLQLTTAVEALSKHAQEDANSNQMYAGCIIQPSQSGKAWKPTYRDHREGTVESTGDFKKFISNMAKEEEERMSRPKPTPGGALDDSKSENGEPVAAIVKYLRARRQQETKRTMATRKKIAASVGYETKGKKNNSTANNKRGPNKPKKERVHGGGRNQKKVGNGAKSVTAPVLMKTSGGG
jgi:hypothetical protein